MSRRGRGRDVNKERFWREAIGRWRRSGQTIRGFCRKQGLSEVSFHAWRRTIAQRDEQVPCATPLNCEPVFVPVRLTPAVPGANEVPLELVLGSGRIVRVPPGFDADTLRQLLTVLDDHSEGNSC